MLTKPPSFFQTSKSKILTFSKAESDIIYGKRKTAVFPNSLTGTSLTIVIMFNKLKMLQAWKWKIKKQTQ